MTSDRFILERMNLPLLVSLLLLCVSCAPQEINVGVLSPTTGHLARFGEYMHDGFELALENVTIDGKHINLIYEDTNCIDLAATTNALKKFKEVDNVVAVLGPYCGGPNKLAGQFSTDNNLFIISPGDNLGFIGKYQINTRYLLEKEAALLAEYAVNHNWTKLGILYFDNDWGQGYRDGVAAYLEEHDGELVSSEAYTPGDFDVRTHLLKIKESEPDAAIIIDALAGELFQQVREIDLNVPLLSEWEIEKPETQGVAGDALEGVIYFLPSSEETDVHKRFEEKYGEKPNIVHLNSYDAATILINALKECPEHDADCMLNYATSLQDFPGAGGPLTFDKETWSFERPLLLKTVKNSTFVVLE